LSLQTQAVCFVEIFQSIVKLNCNVMAIPDRGVILNCWCGPTNNVSLYHRLCSVERNAWSINNHLNYQIHSLHIGCTHIKSLIILYAFFVFYVFSVSLQRLKPHKFLRKIAYKLERTKKKRTKILYRYHFFCGLLIHNLFKLTL
jgi:hypothetical protein